jgi:hypothetical protein
VRPGDGRAMCTVPKERGATVPLAIGSFDVTHDMQKLDAGADRTAMRPGHPGRLRGARVAEALGMVKEWSMSRLTSFDSASWSRKTDEARSKD